MESPLPVGSLRVRLNRVSPAQGQVEVLHAHSATEGPGTCSLTVELVRAQALVPPGLAVGDRCALHSRKGSLMGIEEIAVSLSLPSNSSESFSPSQPKQTRQRSAPCSARHLRAPARYSQYLAPRAIDACREARVRVAGRAGMGVLSLLGSETWANSSAAAVLYFLIPPVSDQKAALNHASSLIFRGGTCVVNQGQ